MYEQSVSSDAGKESQSLSTIRARWQEEVRGSALNLKAKVQNFAQTKGTQVFT